MNDYKINLSKSLLSLREKAGKTQRELAGYLAIDRTTYAKYEAGASEPDVGKIVAIADFYGVTVDNLLGHTSPKREPSALPVKLSLDAIAVAQAYDAADDEQRGVVRFALRDLLAPPASAERAI